MEGINQMIEQIRPIDSTIANALTSLAYNFEYDKILSLLK
jgi:hypothetical protein